MRQTQATKQGFALVELLVVFFLVAIVAMVAVPSYKKALHHAQQQNDHVPALAKADQALAKLPWQELAYRAPESVEIGAGALVEVAIGGDESLTQLTRLLQSTGEAGGERVQVSDRMQAHLTGEGFEITPTTPEIQLVSTREPTLWQWRVKASSLGDKKLDLSMNAQLTVNGKEAAKSVRTFEREIHVRITSVRGLWSFIEYYWAYLGALATGLISLVVYFWKKKVDNENVATSPTTP
jgi:type II secretory pathway component PulJ